MAFSRVNGIVHLSLNMSDFGGVIHFISPLSPTDVARGSHGIAVLSGKRPSLGPLDQSVTFKYTAIS